MFASRYVRLVLPLAATAALLLAACGGQEPAPSATALDSAAVRKDTTINASLTQTLRRQKRFRLFSTLLDSANLAPVLERGGPYTVFAATNPGLDKMPAGLIDELLLPANRERLRQIVGYHIHRGRLSKDSLRGMTSITTLTGQTLPVSIEGGRVLIGEERMSEYAITATNGRIFAFDALVMPPVGGATEALPSPSTYDTLGFDNSAGNGGGDGSRGGSTSGDSSGDSGGSSGSGSSGNGS